jgi:uncharacterized OsmC-like protein
MTRTATTRNGIDLDALQATIAAIEEDAGIGAFTFRAASAWRGGTHNAGRIGGFAHAGSEDTSRRQSFLLEGDEPSVLLGTDQGPNAVELLLQALAFCYAVGYAANAAARGIDLTSMEYEVEGDIDVRAVLGEPGPRAGFSAIRARAIVSSSNASEAELAELCRFVQETSPVRDCLVNPVPVDTVLEVR